MGVLVRIPTPLRKFTDGQSTVEVEGSTVVEILRDLDLKYPGIREKLYDGKDIKRFINIYLNDEDIRLLGGEQTSVSTGDKVSIIPAISGG